MEGLNVHQDPNEEANFGALNYGGMQEEADYLAPALNSTFQTAAPTLLREISGSGYLMAHHNATLWAVIRERVQPIADGEATFEDIAAVINFFTNDQQFQSRYRRRQNTEMIFMLDQFFQGLTQHQRIFYQTTLLPNIAKLILLTEELFPLEKRIPILTQDENRIGSLSKKQCACLIAHMIFCITVDQPEGFKLAELIDFSVIYLRPGLPRNLARKIHKIRCVFTYFEKIFTENMDGNVVFERLSLEGTHNEDTWAGCDETITNAQILAEGGIEDARDALQVIFSDKELGDQVLQLPTTQQQIMSLIHPEVMLSLLFCEELKKDETVRIYGAGRYSNYRGYGDTFEFVEPYTEVNGSRERQHVIMDAEKYNSKQAASQFDGYWVIREMNKAYAGFIESEYEETTRTTMEVENENNRRVATGKWGCGVFQGNPQLKFIIQWLAASRAHRDIVFYSYADAASFNLEETQRVLNHYTGKEVRDLFKDLARASMEMQTISDIPDEKRNLFRVLIAQNEL